MLVMLMMLVVVVMVVVMAQRGPTLAYVGEALGFEKSIDGPPGDADDILGNHSTNCSYSRANVRLL